jgi:hypothetical protein
MHALDYIDLHALNRAVHTGQLTTIEFGIFHCGTKGTQWHGTQFCNSVTCTACAEVH